MKDWLKKILKKQNKRLTPDDRERQLFEQEARQQFIKLKEKGLNLPIVSL